MTIRTLRIIITLLSIVVFVLLLALTWFVFFSEKDKDGEVCDEHIMITKETRDCPDTSVYQEYSKVYTSSKDVQIVINGLKDNQLVGSPLVITGQVPGSWSFEADFPVVLKSKDGDVFSSAIAQIDGDWMTEELVPFKVSLDFSETATNEEVVTLVFIKDNPSGLPENDDELEIDLKTGTKINP